MRVKNVTYRRNAEVEKFIHQHVECTVELEPGDDPDRAFLAARSFVERKLELVKPLPHASGCEFVVFNGRACTCGAAAREATRFELLEV
jgi:hypothetical protein